MHVQVDVDRPPAGDPTPHLGVAARVVAAGGRPARRSPRPGRRPRPSRGPRPGALPTSSRRRAALASRRSSWPASVIASPGWNSSPRSPSPMSSVIERDLRADRDGPGGERLREPGAARAAGRRRRRRGCRRPRSAPRGWCRRRRRRARARAAAGRPGRRRRPSDQTAASQSPAGSSRRIARRNSRSAPRSSSQAEGDPQRPLAVLGGLGRPPRLDVGVGARLDPLVGAGEEALDQLLGRRRARRPSVEPAEEDLDQRPGDLGRERALVRLVEGADVERARVAQRGRG